MQLSALDLRKGTLIDYQGRMCWVTDWNIIRNDRRQFVQMTVKDLLTGRVTELPKGGGDTKYEVFETDQVDLSHSFTEGPEEVFFDDDGVEYRCPREAAVDSLKWPVEKYVGMLVDGKLVAISLPRSIAVVVAEASPTVKGVLGGLKEAVLENGVRVKVGQLVQPGDRIRIDSETLEFKERL
jgi:elongation factor P